MFTFERCELVGRQVHGAHGAQLGVEGGGGGAGGGAGRGHPRCKFGEDVRDTPLVGVQQLNSERGITD